MVIIIIYADVRVQPPYTEILLYLLHRLEITHPTHFSQSASYIWKDRNNTIQFSYQPSLHHLAFQSLPPYPRAIPPKLVKKILALEYIDMSELLSEHYDDYDETESTCCGHTTGPLHYLLVRQNLLATQPDILIKTTCTYVRTYTLYVTIFIIRL